MKSTKSKSSPTYRPADDYYTPKWLFEALGLSFDLDVCAPKGGVPWVPALQSFDLELDGLAQQWHGLVWCNPPYSNPRPWIEKFINHGNGVMLVQVSRSIGFEMLWNKADGIALTPRSIKFEHKDEGTKAIFMPVALFAIGDVSYQALVNSNLGRVR